MRPVLVLLTLFSLCALCAPVQRQWHFGSPALPVDVTATTRGELETIIDGLVGASRAEADALIVSLAVTLARTREMDCPTRYGLAKEAAISAHASAPRDTNFGPLNAFLDFFGKSCAGTRPFEDWVPGEAR